MQDWQDQLTHSITDVDRLAGYFELDEAAREAAAAFPVRLTPYVLSLARSSPAVARQFLPDGAEMIDADGPLDPLREERARPVPCVIHRYPDRLLLMPCNRCFANCRFCTRKRRLADARNACVQGGWRSAAGNGCAAEGVEYIRARPNVRQVILSGGEPLLLEDDKLVELLDDLRSIDHVRVLRIHTRAGSTLPMRVTSGLCNELRRRQPLYVIFHFNHPDELTEEAKRACTLLADAGIALGNQSVLLRDVNDAPHVMQELVEGLLELRVRPYYLHHSDGTRGTRHFDVDSSQGVKIISHLRAHCSGLAVPHYVRDEAGAPFKEPLM